MANPNVPCKFIHVCSKKLEAPPDLKIESLFRDGADMARVKRIEFRVTTYVFVHLFRVDKLS